MEIQLNINYLNALMQAWHIDVNHVSPEVVIAGSPERTLRRMVVTDGDEQTFVLEELSPQTVDRKRAIAELLISLSNHDLTRVHPCLRNREGDLITVWDDRCWQLRPYVSGVILPRPEYLEEAWRGDALADFLIDLHEVAIKAEYVFPAERFSIVSFIKTFAGKLSLYHPGILYELTKALDFLTQEFFLVHDALPHAFCHGDYHPLNVIWSGEDMLSVIDWEFCGYKPETYDLALLIGCLGMEDPQALQGPLVRSLMTRIRESGLYSKNSLAVLPELVMAIRFAWLSEWLRKKDEEMVRLELDYLRLLLTNKIEIGKT